MAIIDVSTPQSVIEEYRAYSEIYDYNRTAPMPYTQDEFVKAYLPPIIGDVDIKEYSKQWNRPDAIAFNKKSNYVSIENCFKLKAMGFNTEGKAYWKYDSVYDYSGHIFNLAIPKKNSECRDNEAIIPYHFYDYLKFIYEFNEKHYE